MKNLLMVVAAFSLLGSLILVGTSWSQQPAVETVPAQLNTPALPEVPGAVVNRSFVSGYPAGTTGLANSRVRSEIGRLMNQLRGAEDDAKKGEITKQLESAVDKYFDEDMKARETELKNLEERLTKLRGQLDRRRKAKADIIQLQIKVLVNEAEGLGFSPASDFVPAPNSPFYFHSTGPSNAPAGQAGAYAPVPVARPRSPGAPATKR